MTNEDQILSILRTMQSDIAGMKDDIAGMKDDIAGMKDDIAGMKGDIEQIKETQEEHTVALNELIRWADDAQVVVKVPFVQPKAD